MASNIYDGESSILDKWQDSEYTNVKTEINTIKIHFLTKLITWKHSEKQLF